MARCPNCRHTFRTLADEEGQHDCPFCGFGPEDCERDPFMIEDAEPPRPGPDDDPDIPDQDDEPDNDEPPRACGWCGVTFTETGACGCADDYEHDDERQSAR